MSEKVLFYAPDVDGYQETINWPRTFFTADSGAFEITNKTDPYNQSAIEPIPKYKVSAQYTFFTQKDVAIFESLMRDAKEEFIYMPLWFSLMQLDGAYDSLSSASVPVEAPEGNPWSALDTTNYLQFTAWALGYLTSSATEARANTFFIHFSSSSKYTYNLITDPLISTVDLTNEEIDFASNPTSPSFSGSDKDLVAPVIKVNVTGVDFSYNMTASQIMTATVQMEEL